MDACLSRPCLLLSPGARSRGCPARGTGAVLCERARRPERTRDERRWPSPRHAEAPAHARARRRGCEFAVRGSGRQAQPQRLLQRPADRGSGRVWCPRDERRLTHARAHAVALPRPCQAASTGCVRQGATAEQAAGSRGNMFTPRGTRSRGGTGRALRPSNKRSAVERVCQTPAVCAAWSCALRPPHGTPTALPVFLTCLSVSL